MTADPLAAVSRETVDRFAAFEALAIKWTRRINLVAPATIPDLRSRHIRDSAQLWPLAPEHATRWVDLGAGGGFPGLVIAILAAELRPALSVTLVESDQRKCAFLAAATRELGLTVVLVNRRIEAHDGARFDVVSARALAPLSKLCALAHPYLAPDGVCLFPKGARAEDELTAAARSWHSRVTRIPSVTAPEGVILKLTELHPVQTR